MISLFMAALLRQLQFKRFRHEKYTCNNSRLDLYDIIIRHAKEGSEVKIMGSQSTKIGFISSVSDTYVNVKGDGLNLQINRKMAKIIAQRKNKYIVLQCSPSVFTL